MNLVYKIFKLPIYLHSEEKYYKIAEKDKKKKIAETEKAWNKPFIEIDFNTRMHIEMRWGLPPWEFNDIIGFVNIGMDVHNCLTGEIFLMRKYFPKNHHLKKFSKCCSRKENNQMHYYTNLTFHKVTDWHNNISYVCGFNKLLDETEEILKNKCKTRSHKWVLQKPPFSLECFDFVKIASEIYPNFPKSKN